MKACLIIHPYSARKDTGFGHDRYAYELLKRLPGHGVEPTTVDTGGHQGVAAAMIGEVAALGQLLSKPAADVYHGTATLNSQPAITLRKRPLVTTIHDVLWFFVGARYDTIVKCELKKLAIKRAAKSSDAIIVPYPSTGEFLVNELGTPKERIQCIHQGVDADQFYPLRTGETPRRPKNFPQDGRLVLFVGQVTFGKGVDTLIRCFEQVVARVPDARLVIGSDGWHVPKIRKFYDESRVKDRIHFVGYIAEEDLRDAYVCAEVMAFPSRYGFGYSCLESMACGTPTVSGRTLDGPELIGEDGLLADPNDAEELGSQILRLLEDRAFHAEISRRGLRNADTYRWEYTARETAELYARVTGKSVALETKKDGTRG